MAKNRNAKHGSQRHVERAEQPAHEQIAVVAYRLWEQGGCREGCADEDWRRAEQILREHESAPAAANV